MWTKNLQSQIKMVIDFLLSILLLISLIPLFAIVAIVIKLDSSGPIIYQDKRLGKSKRVFNCLKFRTMVNNNDNILEEYLRKNPDAQQHWNLYKKLPNDPRVTRIGRLLRKTGFDETPQLINIIRGEMSFVGPRPFLVKEWSSIKQYAKEILSVRPGLIGTWLAHGRNENTFSRRIELELDYVRNWSLKTDFLISIKCVVPFFTGKGSQ